MLTVDQRGFVRPFDLPTAVNAPGGNGSDIGAVEVGALQLLSAVSRKTHGTAGTFDVNLPLSGTPGVECRGTNGTATLVLTFTNTVVAGTASVLHGTATVSPIPTFTNSTMTINLTGVSDAQTVTLTLSGVTDTFLQSLPATDISVSFLIGDSNGDGTVNSGDATTTRASSGQLVSASNFRSDFNLDGVINSGDATIVRAHSGNQIHVPARPAKRVILSHGIDGSVAGDKETN